MLSILVGHSFFLRFDAKQFERAKPYPPLATLQVAALLRRLGHHVEFFDAMLAHGTQDFDARLDASRPDVVLLYEDNYNYLSKMCLAKMREAACTMIGRARAAGARVLVAGSDASDAPDVYLAAGADVALRGEGLDALPALLRRLQEEPALSGAALMAGLAQPVALPRPEAAELEAPVAWDLVDIERYRATWQAAHGRFSLNMAASKGCSFRCNWCAKPIWGQRYQQRSPQAVAAEMAELKARFAPDHIWFADDIFGFRADWVQRFADELDRLGGGIPFSIQTRADLISDAMAQALADAGCHEAWIGAESGSQQVLDAMNKGTTVPEIHGARRRLRAAGVRVGFFIQLGYLGEGLTELLQTRELIEQAQPDDIGVSVSYPLPGTRFHEQVKAQLGAKTHWTDSADLAMMFRGTFSTDTYRTVRDLLHAQVDMHRLAGDAHRRALQSLQQRWAALIDSLTPAAAVSP
ncbi:B12-binding domain-containing radical SAM protein [Roseateles puraquae]|uniref:Mg-protoporphyrin IX monomethyl ester oxidative cyclase n=1 Tax=Roseateles puraquae TaxID=431059 RepID=A0A254NCJ4_9BURK|nr:radical SAM protein [Roseateles puraquae]MDG0853499.1 B12-binding domain-containing radical SAM protein [Roseateles puraquae]OWR05676.1 Mg-protoporphyrin IX monomethyl ester oxidative cyclase [Roseateles puraquae]